MHFILVSPYALCGKAPLCWQDHRGVLSASKLEQVGYPDVIPESCALASKIPDSKLLACFLAGPGWAKLGNATEQRQ